MWKLFRDFAFKVFGRALEPYVEHFDSIKPDLLKSDIGLSMEEYVYVTFFTLLLVFILEFPTLVIITSLLFKTALLAFLFSFTATIFILLAVFFFFYSYPSMIAGGRKKNIETALPFATTFMGTIASSGAPPAVIFRILSKFKEYGEFSKEMAKINRDIEAFGMDIIGAIRKTASRSPSDELKQLLWGMETVIATGGNLGDFLHDKSRQLIADYRRKLEQYASTLSLLTEVYITLVLVGSIFFIIMTALFSIFSGGESGLFIVSLQFLVIFFGLPFISVGFIMLLKALAPWSGG